MTILQVHLSPYGAGGSVEESIDLSVGAGEQILQWVGYTACARLAYLRGSSSQPHMLLVSRSMMLPLMSSSSSSHSPPLHPPPPPLPPFVPSGEVHGRYVPQSILDANGVILDVDIVLNEVFSDGAELSVEYSDGPLAYQAR